MKIFGTIFVGSVFDPDPSTAIFFLNRPGIVSDNRFLPGAADTGTGTRTNDSKSRNGICRRVYSSGSGNPEL